jgi:hypothetical protein
MRSRTRTTKRTQSGFAAAGFARLRNKANPPLARQLGVAQCGRALWTTKRSQSRAACRRRCLITKQSQSGVGSPAWGRAMRSRNYGLRNEPNPVFAPRPGRLIAKTKPIRRRLASLGSRDAAAQYGLRNEPNPVFAPGGVRLIAKRSQSGVGSPAWSHAMQSRTTDCETNPIRCLPRWGSSNYETKPIRRRLDSLESRDAVEQAQVACSILRVP